MSITITRGTTDDKLHAVVAELERFQADHPASAIDAYRYGRYTVRVRIVSPAFQGMTRGDRVQLVWPYFDPLDEETLSDVSTLLLLTPDEKATSIASLEFDNPQPPVL